MKVLLPHLTVPGSDSHAPGEGFENWRILLDSKKTLGALMKLLAERATFDNRVAGEASWRRLVDERNEVVHHFASQPFARLSSPREYQEALAFLKARRLSALPMFEMLEQFGAAFLTAMQELSNAA